MKNLLQRWFAPRPRLSPQQSARLASWHALPEPGHTATSGRARLVVVDVETTGLNLMTDTLISIGAVAVVNGGIALSDSFSVVLQQRESSRKENILIHGISGSAQREGMLPADALLAFLEYLGKSPLVAFHVAFDETMIKRAMRQYLGIAFKHPWLDLAYVLPALWPESKHSHRSLDDWSARFAIRNDDRHNAVADALATAELLLVAITQARQAHGTDSYDGLHRLERAFRNSREIF
ncbi:MAG: DNA polymerase III, epsilon subunit [Candidatus Gallionella acididurans]|uniref:DNA polymerase III, epsilon subunit n=1 Tax=Candidatus Gallionella acididurans TaxID=1796491 RepID=A0A139BTF9_9PROT|nr:MAG: DNA polymerase III, epsilon subunit [Candidatus Gallionella acididurans]